MSKKVFKVVFIETITFSANISAESSDEAERIVKRGNLSSANAESSELVEIVSVNEIEDFYD